MQKWPLLTAKHLQTQLTKKCGKLKNLYNFDARKKNGSSAVSPFSIRLAGKYWKYFQSCFCCSLHIVYVYEIKSVNAKEVFAHSFPVFSSPFSIVHPHRECSSLATRSMESTCCQIRLRSRHRILSDTMISTEMEEARIWMIEAP
jgi:hypothetical protein